MKKSLFVPLAVLAVLLSCRKDDPDAVTDTSDPTVESSPVSFDLAQVPYDSLSKYHFFEGPLADFNPSVGVVPFAPINPLFSDYAHKGRFLWMPQGAGATYESDSSALIFPNGAVMIKTFSYDHVQPGDQRRILETRMIFKRNGVWEFADYVWNEDRKSVV